ncbi:MAG: acyl-CoA dehydrogenase family protein [Halioglobus sp.]
MDFELNADQQAIIEAVERLLQQQAGPARANALRNSNTAEGAYDFALHKALDEAGFSGIARDLQRDDGTLAALEAALVVEAISRAGGVVAAATQLLVAPALQADPPAGPIALCTRRELEQNTPVRYLAQASTLWVVDDATVTLHDLDNVAVAPVRTSFGYPMGRIEAKGDLQHVGELHNAAADARRWWRLALAVEASGTMEAALNCVVGYLKQRRQFGRAIGSFQAVQHRLSECAIQVEASRWLAREAAYHNAPEEAAAVAAAFALAAADQLFTETHQLSGAIGFTHEFDLHVWSMRLLALRQELDGVGGARRAVVNARWRDAAP